MYLLRSDKKIFQEVVCYFNFFDDNQIEKIKNYTKNIDIKEAKIVGKENTRKSEIGWIELNDDTEWIYSKIIKKIRRVNFDNFEYNLKYLEILQFTKYQYGYFYENHTDCGDENRIDNYVDIRKLSFSIQLSDANDYSGGELLLYSNRNNEKITAPKKKGTLIFFPSSMVHEVKKVTRGNRNALVGWICGPNIK